MSKYQMITVEAEVSADEVLEDIDDDVLIQEFRVRGLKTPTEITINDMVKELRSLGVSDSIIIDFQLWYNEPILTPACLSDWKNWAGEKQ